MVRAAKNIQYTIELSYDTQIIQLIQASKINFLLIFIYVMLHVVKFSNKLQNDIRWRKGFLVKTLIFHNL